MPSLVWKGQRAYAVHYSTEIENGKSRQVAKWIPLGRFYTKHEGKISYLEHLNLKSAKNNKIEILSQFVPRATEYFKTFKSEVTIGVEENHLAILKAELGMHRLGDLTSDVILAFLARHPTWKKTTIRNRLGLLKQILDYASKCGYKTPDPDPFLVVKIPRPQIYEFKPKVVDPETISETLEKLVPKYKAIAMILLYSGLRTSELWRMTQEHINRKEWVFDLTPEITKTKEGRKVPIHDKIKPLLNTLPIRVTLQAFYWAIRKASGEKVTPYTLRHQFASNVVNTSKNIRAAQQLLGHKKIEMTARYAWANEETLRDAVAGLK